MVCIADVGSGRTNGADGTPGKPDGGAAPSGTNAGAVNPPPGSGRRLSQLQPGALQTTIGDAQTVEDQANADVADVAADDALGIIVQLYHSHLLHVQCSESTKASVSIVLVDGMTQELTFEIHAQLVLQSSACIWACSYCLLGLHSLAWNAAKFWSSIYFSYAFGNFDML